MMILVPTDLSQAAANAFNYALHLALQMEADITVLYIKTKLSDTQDFENHIEWLNRIIVKEGAGQVTIKYVCYEGTMSAMTLEYAHCNGISLIVLGIKEKINAGNISVEVQEIWSGAVCNVITVPEQCSFRPLTKIIMLAHLDRLQKYELHNLARFTEWYNGHINVLQVKRKFTEADQELLDHWAKNFKNLEVSFHILVSNDSDIVPCIEQYAAANDAVAVGIHIHSDQPSGKRNLLLKLASFSNYPVIVMHSHD